MNRTTTHPGDILKEELQARIKKSEEDIKAGRVYSMDEVTNEMETKYPWLCE